MKQGNKMKTQYVIGVTTLTLTLISSPLMAGEGKALYEKNCTRCHSSEVFTREDRGIKNLEALMTRVKQCTGAAEVKWTDEEVKTVANYLNKDFYKF
jgi:mono/diheme cytochrome c family protein